MPKHTFCGLLVALDGAHQIDARNCDTIQECWEEIDDMGSRWFFYPVCFVMNENTKKISGTPEPNFIFKRCKGMTMAEAKEYVKKNAEEIVSLFNAQSQI
jgi:hypothetical protein